MEETLGIAVEMVGFIWQYVGYGGEGVTAGVELVSLTCKRVERIIER